MTKSNDLTERQQRVLAYIKECLEMQGAPPTLREIGINCGISSTSVSAYNLHELERKGCIILIPEVSRGIRLSASKPLTPAEARANLLAAYTAYCRAILPAVYSEAEIAEAANMMAMGASDGLIVWENQHAAKSAKELEAYWPNMTSIPDGIDRFAQYPIAGKVENHG